VCTPIFFKDNFDIFQPENYFWSWYFYYFGLGYFCYQVRVSIGLAAKFDNEIIFKGIIYSIIIACATKCLLKFMIPQKIKTIFVNKYLQNNILRILIFLTLLNTIITTYYWYKLGGIPILIRDFHNSKKLELGIGLGYIEYLHNFLSLLIYLQVIVLWNRGSKYSFILWLIIYNIFFLPILSDSRSSAIFAIVNIFMLYSWNHKPMKIFTIFLLGVLLAVAASVWGAIRDGVSILNAGMFFLVEVAVEYDSYLDVINLFPTQFDFQYGATLISCLALLFPRFLLPNKNDFITGGAFLKEIKQLYHIRVGVRMTLPGEMYMNFGIIGIIFSIFILTLLLSMLKIFYSTALQTNNYIVFLISFVVLNILKSFLAGDMATAFTFSFYNILFIIICIIMLVSMKNKTNSLPVLF
jgi:hypothetical protein